MPDAVFAVLVAVTWVTLGVASALLLGRHGRRSWPWWVIGVALGPIMLPIAVELVQRDGTVLTRSYAPHTPEVGPPAVTALVGVDGSEESDHALMEASDLLAGGEAQFLLLTVLDPDRADVEDEPRQRAEELLLERSRWLAHAHPPLREIATGPPARVILERAAASDVDLVVVGRRGRGLSELLLGSVADQVVKQSPRPVFLGTPAAERTRRQRR